MSMYETSQLRTKDIIDPSYPLLEANRSNIESIQRKSYIYGATETHQLDVYYPIGLSEDKHKPPILVFFCGGGFTNGSLRFSSNLVYNNLGAFFASRGVVTIVVNYRLVPHAHFPDGLEDVQDALLWIILHVSEGDSKRIFILGHSVGGVHTLSMLLDPLSFTPPLVQAIRGVFLLGVPYDLSYSRSPKSRAAAEMYYDGANKIPKNHPLGLLRKASSEKIRQLPLVWNILARSEPRAIQSGSRTFGELYRLKGGVLEDIVLEGHDHFSPVLALSSGMGEEWAEKLVKQMLVKSRH